MMPESAYNPESMVMTIMADIAFEPLPIRRRALATVIANQYRVKAKTGEAREIEANTAYEAFRLSGFDDAIRIERLSNFDHPLLEKSELTDPPVAAEAVSPEASKHELLESLKLQKNPILSATDLDALMRSLQKAPEADDALPAAAMEMPTAEMQSAENQPPASETQTPGMTGMDVHNDGFDEIIPSSAPARPLPAPRPAPAQAAEPKSEPAPPIDIPERELSKEEIDKLLGDNN